MQNFNSKKTLKVYAITDRKYILKNNYTMEEAVENAIKGGATIIQLREKELDFNLFLKQAISLKKITSKYNIPLIINDNIDVAIKSNADGVHLGQSDIIGKDLFQIRKLFQNKIIGLSANSLQEALIGEKYNVDYLGIDTPFSNTKYSHNTKKDAKQTSFANMIEITNKIKIPCVAIGGIHKNTIPLLRDTGVSGVAMISAIFDNKDIKQETVKLTNIINKYI